MLPNRRQDNIIKTPFSCERDGLILRGTEYRPQGKGLPVAIVCHGFMAFQDTVRHYARFLASKGYAAYCFDFSGGCVIKGKSDGKTTDMSVLTEVKDLEAVICYAKALPYTDPNRLLLMGCSQGGFVSALTAARNKGLASKLVLFYPALCIPDDARAGKMMFARFDPRNLPEVIRCGPMKLGKCYVEDVLGMDPCKEIEGFDGDVLIVHGTADKIVNLRYAEAAYQTYKNAPYDRKVCYHTIEKGAHFFSKKHDSIAMAHLEQFLA